jgi:hypothetical protein
VKVVGEDKLKARILGDRSEQHEKEEKAATREVYIYRRRQKAKVREVAGARLVTCWLKKLPGGFTAKEEGGDHPGHSAVKEDTESR